VFEPVLISLDEACLTQKAIAQDFIVLQVKTCFTIQLQFLSELSLTKKQRTNLYLIFSIQCALAIFFPQ
jgi:hypothetical protein